MPDTSLAAAVLCVVSRTGLGMLEDPGVAGLVVVNGMAPRPCPRPGVPLTVPGVPDIFQKVPTVQLFLCPESGKYDSRNRGKGLSEDDCRRTSWLAVEEIAVRIPKFQGGSTGPLASQLTAVDSGTHGPGYLTHAQL